MSDVLLFPTEPPCRSIDAEVFFIDCRYNEHRKAIALCNRCPYKQECLDHALKYDYYGIWGGTTAAERKHMQQELGITPIGMYQLVEAVLGIKSTSTKPKPEEERDYEQHLEDSYNSEGEWGHEN